MLNVLYKNLGKLKLEKNYLFLKAYEHLLFVLDEDILNEKISEFIIYYSKLNTIQLKEKN